VPQSVQAAQNELKDLERLIQQHNSRPPDPSNWSAVESYNNEADYYNAWATQLHGKLDSWNTQYTPASPAKTANTPSWTQPAPQQPTPSTHPQPSAPSSPSIAEQAREIGKELSNLPKGTRLDTLADRITDLHLNPEQAAEATDIAAKTAFGESGGIVNVPDGTKVVLPADLTYGRAMVVHPGGSVTVFVGDLHQFLPYIGK
jgi:pyruvate/2-oxoglutarate dehydrogenase complex dihydrolipoamide acyltransferase (E2) component